MIEREFRRADVPQLLALLRTEFPEEERIMGTRPEGFTAIARRVFRWDTQLILGLLRLVGRPIFRFLVVEDSGRLGATTLLTFSPKAGYVSMVVVDPALRRRGFARRLLETARAATLRRGKPFVVLDVLRDNTAARTLYESVGYRPLRTLSYLVREPPLAAPDTLPGASEIRPFERPDAKPLADVANRQLPTSVAEVLPVGPRDLSGGDFANRLLQAETAAWVVDRGQGPEAYTMASISGATESAHLACPIVGPDVPDEVARSLVRTALTWVHDRGERRVMTSCPDHNARGRAALTAEGFHDALAILTLYRPSA